MELKPKPVQNEFTPQEKIEEFQKQLQAKLPKDAQERLKEIMATLETFKSKITEKFDKYIVGIALLPPKKPAEGEKADTKTVNVLVLVDDTDSKKMSKLELKDKLASIIEKMGKEIDPNLAPRTVILSDLWMGKIKPSQEEIDLFMSTGEQAHKKFNSGDYRNSSEFSYAFQNKERFRPSTSNLFGVFFIGLIVGAILGTLTSSGFAFVLGLVSTLIFWVVIYYINNRHKKFLRYANEREEYPDRTRRGNRR